MEDYSWTCPYCRQVATITDKNVSGNVHYFDRNNKLGYLGIHTHVTVCPNSKCKEFTITAALYKANSGTNHLTGEAILRWDLKPQSSAKPFPDYIPAAILQDYAEACLIRDLSPKASATLARRCLQGMIRDFWGIKKNRLVEEIEAIHDKVDPVTWAAIDAVRKIGNIGAHMEKDIDLIIDVEPREAGLLIGLIETLINDWYVVTEERKKRMEAIIGIAVEKKEAKNTDTII